MSTRGRDADDHTDESVEHLKAAAGADARAGEKARDEQGLETGLSEGDFHETLSTLLGEIDMLPAGERERLKSVAEATRRRQDELRETVERLQETLDYLRLNIKYLCFDVEATKRENRYLRKVLDERSDPEA